MLTNDDVNKWNAIFDPSYDLGRRRRFAVGRNHTMVIKDVIMKIGDTHNFTVNWKFLRRMHISRFFAFVNVICNWSGLLQDSQVDRKYTCVLKYSLLIAHSLNTSDVQL